MKQEGPLTRPFVVLSSGNDEFAVLDGDTHLLAGEESGVFDPFGAVLLQGEDVLADARKVLADGPGGIQR